MHDILSITAHEREQLTTEPSLVLFHL